MYKIQFISKQDGVLELYAANSHAIAQFCKMADIPDEKVFESTPYAKVDGDDTIVISEVDLVLSTPEVTNKN